MTTVTNQSELDAAIAAKAYSIIIDSPAGVWLTLRSDPNTSRVVAWGSSSVVARESSRVVARGSSSVEAWESSRVEARESSRVEAWGSSSVEAWGSSSVVAWESSRVVAWGSSSVVARESSSVVARESSRVVAGKYTSVHLWSQRVVLDSAGAVIDMTSLDFGDPTTWAEYYGAKSDDGKLVVFKAVDDALDAGHSYKLTKYPIGETVKAPDWRSDSNCGHGLHFAASPSGAKSYFSEATRFLACEVDVATMVPLGDKIKAESCRVLREVDITGEAI